MLNCRQFVEVVTDYLENALDDEMRRETEEHLAGCGNCLRYLGQIQTVIRILGHVMEENQESQPN